MNKTKVNILDSAIKLFNEQGLVNVRLQHIADEAFISIGNLAYHYKTKADIVAGIHQRLEEDQKKVMAEMNVVPLFEYMGQFLIATYELQDKYSFFFTDMLEVFRSYPDVSAKHKLLIAWQKQQYQLALEFNMNRGALKGMEDIDINATIDNLWISTYMFRSFALINDEELNLQKYCNHFWNILIPLMSEKGLIEFKQYRQLSIML